MSNIRNRSCLTLSLITNPERLLGKGKKVRSELGHTQLRLHFTNQERDDCRLIRDRNAPKDATVATYRQVDTHLLIRVGEGSRKLGQYMDVEIGKNDHMVAARKGLAVIREELEAVRAKIPGYSELLREYRKMESDIEKLDHKLEKQFSERGFKDRRDLELRRMKREKRDGFDNQLAGLLEANPADKARLETLLKDREQKLAEIEAIDNALRQDEEFAKEVLKRYLADEKLGNLPEHEDKDAKKVFNFILKGQIVLYALELSGKCQTDRLGVPLAEKVEHAADGAPGTELVPCDRELSIPWDYVFTGMTTHMNNLYRPGERGAQKHFVFANPTEAQSQKEDDLAKVDSVMVGCMPSHAKDERGYGWAVIIRKRQWAEVMKNLDFYRTSGIIKLFLECCPDPNPPARKPEAKESKPEAEADMPQAEEPAEEPRQTGEPAGSSASVVN